MGDGMFGAHETGGRALHGAIAGIVGTAAMTTAMRWLHGRLPERERYPLPPREIIERTACPDHAGPASALAAHYAYGAVTGALYALFRRSPRVMEGAAYGVAVWGASYLGWIPGLRILAPASRHPMRRNWLMLAVHLVWGGTLALALQEARRAEEDIFFDAPDSAPDRRG